MSTGNGLGRDCGLNRRRMTEIAATYAARWEVEEVIFVQGIEEQIRVGSYYDEKPICH